MKFPFIVKFLKNVIPFYKTSIIFMQGYFIFIIEFPFRFFKNMILLFYKASAIFMQRCVISIMDRVLSPTFPIILSDRTCGASVHRILGTLFKKHSSKYSKFSLDIIAHQPSSCCQRRRVVWASLIHNASRGCIVSRCAGPD